MRYMLLIYGDERAVAAYRRALDLATNPQERAFLQRRLAAASHDPSRLAGER